MKKELIIIGAGGYAKSVLDSFDPQQYDFRKDALMNDPLADVIRWNDRSW